LPQVWTRGLLYWLVIFAAMVLPWAMLSKVDETGTARGRLEPKGKTVRLDAAVAGTVAEIRVKEGDLVKAGQTLLVLESELVKAELRQAQ
ncbi:MAG: biotin/lipoyl-binding protein, partial [Nostoc sp.]